MQVIADDLRKMRVKAGENFKCGCDPPNAGDLAYMVLFLHGLFVSTIVNNRLRRHQGILLC